MGKIKSQVAYGFNYILTAATIRAAADENLSLRLDVSRLWPPGQLGFGKREKKE